MKSYRFPVLIEQDEDGYYIGVVPDLKGCHTQARSLGELEKRLHKGSHAYYRHVDGRATVVPMHRGEDLGRGLIRTILRDIEISPEEFSRLL